MHTVRQILFTPPAPIIWAEACGAFRDAGVEVATTLTTSSDEISQGLAEGSYDLGIGVVDNAIAWAARTGTDLRIIAQLERSTIMSFCAAPRFTDLPAAAAEPIAIDAADNGFVLVLYRALARAGIDWRSCPYDLVGGVRQRYEALIEGRANSTILIPPFDAMAAQAGFRILWRGQDIAPLYPGVVAIARGSWIDGAPEAATAYVRALRAADRWARDPGNAAAAISALEAARYPRPAAERLLHDAVAGLTPDRDGWQEVVALRTECGLLPDPPPDEQRMIDTSLLEAAG